MVFDPSTISASLASLKVAVDIARFVQSSYGTLEKAEARLKLVELLEALTEAKVQVSSLADELNDRDREIRSLKEKLELREAMVFEAPYFWIKDGSSRQGPYCQHCYQSDGKKVNLISYDHKKWQCKTCKNYYHDADYVPSHEPLVHRRRDPYL